MPRDKTRELTTYKKVKSKNTVTLNDFCVRAPTINKRIFWKIFV